jgi:hypothetical protein
LRRDPPYFDTLMDAESKREPGRRCSAPACETVLSVYNADHLCFAHADVVSRALFERRAPVMTSPPPYRQRIDLSVREPATS